MDRIEKLMREALENPVVIREFFYRFYKAFGDSEKEMTYGSYADAYYRALCELTPVISEGELIVGKIGCVMTPEENEEWENIYLPVGRRFSSRLPGQDSHMAIDYELVLSEGLTGIIARIDGYLETCKDEQRDFYKACRSGLKAVIAHSNAYAAEAERMAGDCTGVRKDELIEIARICRKVPAYPAESFYEAVQFVNFFTYVLSLDPLRLNHQQFQLGRPDRYLWRFYKHDLETGAITKERAQLLLDCICIQINNRVCRGLSSGFMVGGRDENGSVVENELTEMCMQVIDDIRLVYPSVGLCYTEGMSDEYLSKACEILSHGRSHPAIFNDDVISKGLVRYGVPEKDSHGYIHSTCVEITPLASSNVWVASPYTNMPQLFLDTMVKEYGSFEENLDAFFSRLDSSIRREFEAQNEMRKQRAKFGMNPLLSTVVKDCLENGTDIEKGGARYNWIMPSFVGMANLVDSLVAVKEIVYDKKEMSLCELKSILDSDFEGYESFRLRLLDKIPKYGNNDDTVDSYFSLVASHIVKECKKYRSIHRNAVLVPSVFCWVMHEYFGSQTGATPDGRKAGFPLGDGSGPCQGREKQGPTASILSSTAWDHADFIGGVAVNMKFSKQFLGRDSLKTMAALIKTYFRRGGFEIQINVVDKSTLEAAIKDPESYRDLVVRIGGYSDYFVRLSKQMQAEVIQRTSHNI